MLDWNEVIDSALEAGEISEKEASELKHDYQTIKEAGVFGAAKKGLLKIPKAAKAKLLSKFEKFKTFAANPTNLQALGLFSIGLPLSYELGKGVARPIVNARLYGKMREHLDQIEPSISRNYSDDHIKKVYSIVSQFSPTIASNPYVSATVVRDAINVPTNMDLRALKTISDIENTVSGHGQSGIPGAVSASSDKLLGMTKEILRAQAATGGGAG